LIIFIKTNYLPKTKKNVANEKLFVLSLHQFLTDQYKGYAANSTQFFRVGENLQQQNTTNASKYLAP
jgi:hypothetical protein